MRKLTLILTLILFISSCSDKQRSDINKIMINRELKYYQDKKTNICFAYIGFQDSFSITNVPCTKEVLKEIEKN